MLRAFSVALCLSLPLGCSPSESDPSASTESGTQPAISSWDVSLHNTLWEIERLQSEAMTQSEMNHTAFLELEVLEATLFISMSRYQEGCSPETRASFAADHEAWLDRRNAAAAEERSAHEGGTIAPLIEATEMSDWTRYRISAIDALHARGADCASPEKDRTAWRVTDVGLLEGDSVILDQSVSFSLDAVRSVLPAGTVSEGVHEDESGTYPTLELAHGLDFMGRVYGSEEGMIETLEITLAGTSGPDEATIGWPMTYMSPERFECFPGTEHHSGDAICFDDRHPYISYVFRPDDWSGPDGELPEAQILEDWRLWTLYWTAPDPEGDSTE